MMIFRFGPKGTVKWHMPFWQPWGCLGCLGRLLLFLLLLYALLFLLSLFRACDSQQSSIPDDLLHPRDTTAITRVPIDTTANVRKDIANPGPNLPPPADNYLPPLDTTRIVRDEHGGRFASDRFNVLLDDPQADDETFRKWAEAFKTHYPGDDYRITYYDPLTKLMQVSVPPDDRIDVMRRLPEQVTGISFLVFAEGIMEQGSAAVRPNDPAFNYPAYSWQYAPVQAFDAWGITQGSADVTVAIVDSYFDLNHEELNSSRITKAYSVRRRTGNVSPDPACPPDSPSFMHGTFVASLAVGNSNNGRGTAGMAPRCRLMPVSMGHPGFTAMTMLEGVLYAIYQGADVINVSAGFPYETLTGMPIDEQIALSRQLNLDQEAVWNYAFKLANERNVTIVWAAGNDNVFGGLDASKRDASTVRVSAVDPQLRKASFSNFGNFPEKHVATSTVSAPGAEIFAAMPYNTYTVSQGTSFAAPIVTGVVALMKSLDPTLTNAAIVDILKKTGRPVAGCTTIGPLVQARDALLRVKAGVGHHDDVMNDPQKFIGRWQAVRQLKKTVGGVPTGDKLNFFFDITSATGGRSVIRELSRPNHEFTAPISVSHMGSEIRIAELSAPASTTTPVTYQVGSYRCVADANGLLKCTCSYSDGTTTEFYIKKTN